MAALVEIPCIEIEKKQQLSVSLPFGGSLSSLTNIADGPPTDCALAHSLIIQIMPMMASMTCLLPRAQGDLGAENHGESRFIRTGDLLSAIGEMTECLGIVLSVPPICAMVKDILLLVISYLNCMIEAVESVLNFSVGIDLNAAQGNPALLASLECAQKNAQTSLESTMGAMAGLQPLIELVNTTLSIIGQGPISLTPHVRRDALPVGPGRARPAGAGQGGGGRPADRRQRPAVLSKARQSR